MKNYNHKQIDGDAVSIEDYNQLARELERLQKDEAREVEELIQLKWSNACLRHELMRRNQEHTEEIGGVEEFGSDNELNRGNLVRAESYFGSTNGGRVRSRRRKLIAKLKRWVEGGEKPNKQSLDEKESHGNNKCFPRHSASEEAYLSPTRSCSSA